MAGDSARAASRSSMFAKRVAALRSHHKPALKGSDIAVERHFEKNGHGQ